MTEWEVVGVIVVLVTLISVFVTAAVGMTKSVQKNTDATDRLTDAVSSLKTENTADHTNFRDELSDHETRITVLEKK